MREISVGDGGAGGEILRVVMAVSCRERGDGMDSQNSKDLAGKTLQSLKSGMISVGKGIFLLSKSFNGGKRS